MHSLTQYAVVMTEMSSYLLVLMFSNVIYSPQTQRELVKKVTDDPKWSRVICQPLLMQVIEDIAKDCCNNANTYKLQKQRKYGMGQ
jgi:hypothetical protein